MSLHNMFHLSYIYNGHDFFHSHPGTFACKQLRYAPGRSAGNTLQLSTALYSATCIFLREGKRRSPKGEPVRQGSRVSSKWSPGRWQSMPCYLQSKLTGQCAEDTCGYIYDKCMYIHMYKWIIGNAFQKKWIDANDLKHCIGTVWYSILF